MEKFKRFVDMVQNNNESKTFQINNLKGLF